MDPMLPIFSLLGYWAIILATVDVQVRVPDCTLGSWASTAPWGNIGAPKSHAEDVLGSSSKGVRPSTH